MLPDKIKLDISTPDREVLSASVDEVILPGAEGYLGVLPGHAPLIANLDVGEIAYRVGSEQKYAACSGGFAEVLGDSVSVLAETAELASEIDVERARLAQQQAEERLKSDLSDHEFKRAEISLRKAVSRIRISGRVSE
jgi:F-type H+-transporting ATPase subunit epsilon